MANTEKQNPQNASKTKPLHKSNFYHNEPYPTSALGKTLCNATKSITRAADISISMAANSILGAASTCAQSKIIISINYLTFPASLFIITSTSTGERKSGSYKLAMRPIIEFEKNLNLEYKSAKKTAQADKKKLTTIKEPFIIFDNATVEGIYRRFVDSQPYQSISTPEGAALLGSHAMKESQIKFIISLSKLWSMEQLHWITANGGTVEISDSSRLSMHLMIQPSIFIENILLNKLFKEQGFLSRILFCEPKSKIGTRVETVDEFIGFDINKDADYLTYINRISILMKNGYSIDPRKHHHFKTYSMERDSLKVWINYKNKVETESSDSGRYSPIQGIAAKSAEQAIRIAAIITYIEYGEEINNIPPNIMQDGVTLAQWYLHEANRLYSREQLPKAVKDAKLLLNWIKIKNIKLLTAHDLSSRCPLQIRKKECYTPAILLLEEKGYIYSENNYLHQGKTLKKVWHIITTNEA